MIKKKSKVITIVTLILLLLVLTLHGCTEEETPVPTPTPTPTATPVNPNGGCQSNQDCLGCVEKCENEKCIDSGLICVAKRIFTAKDGDFTNLVKEEVTCQADQPRSAFIAQVNGAPLRFVEEQVNGPC